MSSSRYRSRSPRDDRNKSILVRNVSFRTRPNDIRYAFEKFGDVRDVYIPKDHRTGEPRGFAFVEFFDYRDAADAVDEMQGFNLDGRDLAVQFAQERRKTPQEMNRILGGRGFG
eukprot:CAMPEP_0117829698 /NCGR_PEP_ID=MMETSP0949-20121206/8020_1 /TAXON_ID=44440 /ORGANISM="Chattonella subsalsa, Strain CCMP2191" /LENGTH=113 /DNA_ID=CAMNT_0005670497 /DNA_START=30 /DNA_END=368 /DNA_ORIENTATION=+